MRIARRLSPLPLLLLLSACIGDLPEDDFPCLIAKDRYDALNEAYVFARQGEMKRTAEAKAVEAERACVQGDGPP